jgi:Fe-S-cluster containining protein
MGALPWWSDGVRFECQETGRCCVSRGSYGYVYLTLEDRRRLARHFGISTTRFTRRYCERTDGHWRLRGDRPECRFLDGSRCAVYEARPTQCRTWPFWPENMKAKVWTTEIVAFCPGIGKGRLYSGEEIEVLLAASDASATQARPNPAGRRRRRQRRTRVSQLDSGTRGSVSCRCQARRGRPGR